MGTWRIFTYVSLVKGKLKSAEWSCHSEKKNDSVNVSQLSMTLDTFWFGRLIDTETEPPCDTLHAVGQAMQREIISTRQRKVTGICTSLVAPANGFLASQSRLQ
jgi:hypothetical protein